MTDEQIIKALECCAQLQQRCDECPDRYELNLCGLALKSQALKLINRQKAEIERLIEECGKQSVLWRKHFESIFETAKETARAEAVKEFAEQVIDLIYEADDINPVTEWKIRNLLKAFTEEKT